jgi:DNA-binding LacI/PurR family transcriptional regulator
MVKQVRLKDIARKLGLSPATVSQAFNNPKIINRETRRKILELCEELGYVRKKYKHGKNNNIGIIGENHYITFGGFYNFVSTGILLKAKTMGLNTNVCSFEDCEEVLPTIVTKRLVDGIIIVGKMARDHILQIKQENIPIVLCGHPMPGLELHTVVPDGRAGIYETTKHLIVLGHKKIATITGGQLFDPITSDRLDGYRFALTEAGLKVEEDYIAIADFYDLDTVAPAVEKLLSLKNCPTAIACACDAIAYCVIKILTEKGFKVPKDISVTGFDGLPFPDFLSTIKLNLTTAEVPLEQMGQIAIDILLDVIDNPAKVAYRHTVPTKLVIGNTTATAKE